MDRVITSPLPLLLLLQLQLDVSASAQTDALEPRFDGYGIRSEDHDTIDRAWSAALQETGEILSLEKKGATR